MENVLLIPFMTKIIISSKTEELFLLELESDLAIFILGSFVHERVNRNGERKFSSFIKKIPRFEEYLAFFLDNEILEKGASRDLYKYYNHLYGAGELTPHFFDSIIAIEIICKYYPNLVEHLMDIISVAYKGSK
jgi:hypothetical protein